VKFYVEIVYKFVVFTYITFIKIVQRVSSFEYFRKRLYNSYIIGAVTRIGMDYIDHVVDGVILLDALIVET